MKILKLLITFIISHKLIFAEGYCANLKSELKSIEEEQNKFAVPKDNNANTTLAKLVSEHDGAMAEMKILSSLVALKKEYENAQKDLSKEMQKIILSDDVNEAIKKSQEHISVIATHYFVTKAFESDIESDFFKKLADSTAEPLDMLTEIKHAYSPMECPENDVTNWCDNKVKYYNLNHGIKHGIENVLKSYTSLLGLVDDKSRPILLSKSKAILGASSDNLFANDEVFTKTMELYRDSDKGNNLLKQNPQNLEDFRNVVGQCRNDAKKCNIEVINKANALSKLLDNTQLDTKAYKAKIATVQNSFDTKKDKLNKDLKKIYDSCSDITDIDNCISTLNLKDLEEKIKKSRKDIYTLINNEDFKNLERVKSLVYSKYQSSGCLNNATKSAALEKGACLSSSATDDHTKLISTLYENVNDAAGFSTTQVIAQNYNRFLDLDDTSKTDQKSYWFKVQKSYGCTDEDEKEEGEACKIITSKVNSLLRTEGANRNTNLEFGSYLEYDPSVGQMVRYKRPVSAVSHLVNYATAQLPYFFNPLIQTKQLEGNLFGMYQSALYQKSQYSWNQQRQQLAYSNLYNGFLSTPPQNIGFTF